jgi:antitoxin FitA
LAALLNYLGNLAQKAGRWFDAESSYQQSLQVNQALDNFWGLGISNCNLASLKFATGDPAAALPLLMHSLHHYRRAGVKHGVDECFQLLAHIAQQPGHVEPAAWCWWMRGPFCYLSDCMQINTMHANTRHLHTFTKNREIEMAMLTVRNIPDEVHRALRVRAANHGQSMEAEVREILQAAASPKGRVKLGSLLASIGHRAQLTDQEFAVFNQVRDKTPARPVSFE